MQAQHCLWRWDPICEMLALGTQLQGATPYTPLVLWGAVGVAVLGFCLLIATQPWQEGWDRNEGALPVEPPVVEPPEPYRLASAETWRTQIGTMLAILGVLGILTVGIILVGDLLR